MAGRPRFPEGPHHTPAVSRMSSRDAIAWAANFLLSGQRGLARGHRGRLCGQSCPKVLENQGASRPGGRSDRLGRNSRLRPASACGQRLELGLAGTRGKPHDVNLIIGRTCAPPASDRNSGLAANAENVLVVGRVDVSENEKLTGSHRWRGLAAIGRKRRGSPPPAAVNAGRSCGAQPR